MPTDCISYQESGYFTTLMNDYLSQKSELQSLYNRFPTLENFEGQILEKQNNYKDEHRKSLVSVLQKQYENITTSVLTQQNIHNLSQSKTFTITTGHQLNLFSGPLYFLYKIISTINLTKELKSKYPQYNFVPIYWMATEDHDFEEINYFNFKDKKFRWHKDSSGPVGRLTTKGLQEVFEIFSLELGSSSNADEIKKLFQESYLQQANLADATRFLANALFGESGLVILDGDDADLKRLFIPFIKEELLNQSSFKAVKESIEKLNDYSVQVNPREINLFYIEDHIRERIIIENKKYKVNNLDLEFSESELLELVEKSPERFSPNVIMRPLYEEVILPNLCYIGGGGEIAYWLELKSTFEVFKVTFPILLLRNSALLVTEKQTKKADKLQLTWKDLFLKKSVLIEKQAQKLSQFPIDFSNLETQLKTQFDALYKNANLTDSSFLGMVKAQEAKQIKGLEKLKKRLLKAEKEKHKEILERIIHLQNEIFPSQSLQERYANFSEFYLEYGNHLIKELMTNLKPLSNEFLIIKL